MKKTFLLALTIALLLAFSACQNSEQKAEEKDVPKDKTEVKGDDKTEEENKDEKEIVKIKVGASVVPHAKILSQVKEDLLKEGIDLEVVEFSDYVTPNLATDEGDLFANYFQHQPYLDTFNEEHGTKLSAIGAVHIEPISVYSNKIDDLSKLEDGATIAIPNDPSNEGRALLLLERNGFIKLKDSKNLNSTPIDIVENPKNLKFNELESAQLPRVLDDVDAAIINTNFALAAGFDPTKSLLREDSESPYINVVAVRDEDVDSEVAKKLIKALQTEKIKKYIETEFKGAVFPAF